MIQHVIRSRWSMVFEPRPEALLKLFCFPYAGGQGAIFKTWCRGLPACVELHGIQLPGRGYRMAEPPCAELSTLVSDLSTSIAGLLDRPFAFFGHSLGAVVSFEVSRWLRRHRGLLPSHLFVSGRRAPHIPDMDPPTYDKSDEDFVIRLHELNGTPVEVLADQELLRMMLPTVRADFRLVETYDYVPEPPLRCPITAFGGADDEESLDGRLEGWRLQTTDLFASHVLNGDHFFVHSCERELVQLLRGYLSRLTSETTSS